MDDNKEFESTKIYIVAPQSRISIYLQNIFVNNDKLNKINIIFHVG